MRYGAEILAAGKRKEDLVTNIERFLSEAFNNAILPFDSAAARDYAEIMAIRRSFVRPTQSADGQIAAIARSHGLRLATRNVRDFVDMGIEVINPWTGN